MKTEAPTIKKKERNLSIDLIKVIAMSMVVCLHTTFTYVDGNHLSLAFVLYNTGVVAIPLFFMVSGYLLLGRKDISYRYSAVKILRILRFVFIFAFIYFIRLNVLHGDFSVSALVSYFCDSFLQKGPLPFFWYFGSMCIIYILLPFLNRIYADRSRFIILLAVIAVIQSLAFVSNVTGAGETRVTQTFRLWNWLAYFMIGGLLKRYRIIVGRAVAAAVVFGALVINIMTIKYLHQFMATGYCEYFYGCAVTIFLTISIFLSIESVHIKESRPIRELSACFLPVYSLHIFITDIISPFARESAFGCVMYWLVILFTTIAVSLILVRVPVIKNIFKI